MGREAAERQGKTNSTKSWKNLRIVKTDPTRGAIISGLSEYIVNGAEHALEILENGDKVGKILFPLKPLMKDILANNTSFIHIRYIRSTGTTYCRD